MKRFHFNMIEIILAIAIISIGISSVMVLFTSGIKTSNSTVGNSKLPDVAESVISRVKAAALEHCDASGWKNTFDNTFPALKDNRWTYSEKTNNGVTTKKGEKGVNKSDFSFNSSESKDGRVLIEDGSGNFLYRQLRHSKYVSTDSADNEYETIFAAIVEVRQVAPPGNTYDVNSDILMSSPITPQTLLPEDDVKGLGNARDAHSALAKMRRVLEIRISYPADVAMDMRDSKIYRIELYNDKYDGFLP